LIPFFGMLAVILAARVAGLTLAGRPATPLVPRLPLQVIWIGLPGRVAA